MREYISICGLSAAGKKTLIRHLLRDQDSARERFAIPGPIAAFGYSFEPIEGIHASAADFVVHQWQWKTDSVIEALLKRHPLARHRVILIWRPLERQYEDLLRAYRGRWQPEFSTLVDNWNHRIVPRFRDELPSRFDIEIELVDGSSEDYPALIAWPRGGEDPLARPL